MSHRDEYTFQTASEWYRLLYRREICIRKEATLILIGNCSLSETREFLRDQGLQLKIN